MTTEFEVVPLSESDRVLPLALGHVMTGLAFESQLYSNADQKLEGYKGGRWTIKATKDRKLFYFVPPVEEGQPAKITVEGNYFEAEMTADGAGFGLTMFALNDLCWKDPDNNQVISVFYALREAMFEHPECQKILAMID